MAVMTRLRMGGHGGGRGAGADGGGVFVEGDVADVVNGVLDGPVAAEVGAELAGAGTVGGEAGDAPGDFFGGALAVEPAGVLDDAEDMCGVGEVGAVAGGDRCGAHDALLGAAVPAVRVVVFDEVLGRPGQGGVDRAQQGRLVGFHGHDVVGAGGGDQVLAGGPLRVQSIEGDHDAGQVQVGQQRCHLEDLLPLSGICR